MPGRSCPTTGTPLTLAGTTHRTTVGQMMRSVAPVIPSIVLLLGYLSDNSLQLFARLLLILQKLLYPLILLQNENK